MKLPFDIWPEIKSDDQCLAEDIQIAREIYKTLMSSNVDVWFDKVDLIAGQSWDNEIKSAIMQSDAFIALLSSNSVEKRGYVQNELKKGIDQAQRVPEGQIFLIPIRLNLCDLPPSINHIHYIDYWMDDSSSLLILALAFCAEAVAAIPPNFTQSD